MSTSVIEMSKTKIPVEKSKTTSGQITSVVNFPVYGFIIIGAVYVLLISIIIYLMIEKCRKKRRTYNTYETNEYSSQNCLILNDQASTNSNLTLCNEKYHDGCKDLLKAQSNKPKKHYNGDCEISLDEESKPTQKMNRAIEMIKKSNPNETPVLSPEQMKSICDEVLRNVKQKNLSRDNIDIEFKENNNNNCVVKDISFKDDKETELKGEVDIIVRNEELNEKVTANPSNSTNNADVQTKKQGFINVFKEKGNNNAKLKQEFTFQPKAPFRKSVSLTNLDIYDVIRHSKPVPVQIYSTADDIALLCPRSRNFKIVYDSLYRLPITMKTAYVNANICQGKA